MSKFALRPNTSDAITQRNIWESNEYRVPEVLNPEDCVIDVGAHIGLFSYLCWQRGAREIFAFEPFPDNFQVCRSNLTDTSVTLVDRAVWRSDRTQTTHLYLTGFTGMDPEGPDPIEPGALNTGTCSVLGAAGERVEALGLDEVIGDRVVRILKLDCEGSEFPILLTSKRLKQVQYITGEYHLRQTWPEHALIEGHDTYTLGDLANYLTRLRFRVEFVPYQHPIFSDQLGNFFAYNLDA